MTELLATNLSPLKTTLKTFPESWGKDFLNAKKVQIATGYVSGESCALIKTLAIDKNVYVELIVGMALKDGLTNNQFNKLNELNIALNDASLGGVFIVSDFAFHGKVTYFQTSFGDVSYLGSSNLSGIVPIGNNDGRNFEMDVRIVDATHTLDIHNFIEDLKAKSSRAYDEIKDQIRIVRMPVETLIGQKNVIEVGQTEYLSHLLNSELGEAFELPLSTEQASSLNAYFGKPRFSKSGKAMPRDWYEVNLVLPKKARSNALDYPFHEEFIVVTDDGFEFVGKSSGDDGKNFSSRKNNKIIGRWLKGRLQESGALVRGQMVTDEVLRNYGKSSLTMVKTNRTKYDQFTEKDLPIYLLSFSPNEKNHS